MSERRSEKKVFFKKFTAGRVFKIKSSCFGSFSCQCLNFILQASEMENNVIFIFKY